MIQQDFRLVFLIFYLFSVAIQCALDRQKHASQKYVNKIAEVAEVPRNIVKC